jgi:hypothetical protein
MNRRKQISPGAGEPDNRSHHTQAFYARRVRRFSLISACSATSVVLLELLWGTGRFNLAVYSFSCGVAWMNVLAQHNHVRAAQRLNER